MFHRVCFSYWGGGYCNAFAMVGKLNTETNKPFFQGHLYLLMRPITDEVQSVFCMETLSCQNIFYVKFNIQLTMTYISHTYDMGYHIYNLQSHVYHLKLVYSK